MECYWVSQNAQKYDFMRDCRLLSIDGADIEKEINTSSIAGYDGSTYVSEQTPERSILLLIRLKEAASNERAKLIERLGRTGTLYIDSKKIDGRLKSADYIISETEGQEIQITFLCPSPYFTDLDSQAKIMSAVTPLFKFPFTFNGSFKFGERMASVIENFVNDSTVDVYPIIEFKAISALTNPSIMNINTYEKMKVNVSLSAGEKLRIDTRIGKKSITKISGSGETNCFNCMADDFKFFKLYTGDNYLKYDADTNAAGLQTTVQWENLYGGV